MALLIFIDILHRNNDKLSGFYLSNYLEKVDLTYDEWQFYVFGLEIVDCLNDPLLILNNYLKISFVEIITATILTIIRYFNLY